MKQVEIYTDGACSHNPGPGGWGVVLLDGQHHRELSGFQEHTTNQQMELFAAIQGLKALTTPHRVKLYSDSAYLLNAFKQNWLKNWQRNGWMNSRKQPVANRKLWETLVELDKTHSIEWIKVKGHSDNVWNNRCDELATSAIREQLDRKAKGEEV